MGRAFAKCERRFEERGANTLLDEVAFSILQVGQLIP